MKKTLITIFTFLACYGANAETILTIEYLDGKTAKEQLAKVSRIVFDKSDNININYNDGTSKDFGKVTNTQKIVFAEGDLTAAEKVSAAASIRIYPNPTTETISIDGLKQGQVVKIYSVSGKLAQTSNESVVNVSKLADGEYIVVVGQTVAKLIKK